MATKYILDPSGNIIKVNEDKTLSEPTDLGKDNTYFKEVNENISNKEGDDFLSSIDLENVDTFKNFITSKIKQDPAFGFFNSDDPLNTQNQIQQETESFKPFNSFEDTDRVFADEFEILTGYRFRNNETDQSVKSFALMFAYIAEVITKIITVEAIINVNQLLLDGNPRDIKSPKSNLSYDKTSSPNYRTTPTMLRLGKYDYTEYDTFTKYIFNVLNYPHENSNTFERIMAYFVGFNEWISPDSVLDLDNIIKEAGINQNNLQAVSLGNSRSFKEEMSLDLIGNIFQDTTLVGLASVIEGLLAVSLNHTSINRLRLLQRKFYQERLFQSNLYKAKEEQNYIFGIFDDLNYYYFKFMIERIQVGLPILKRYFYGESYLKFNEVEGPENRVSANRFKIGKPYVAFSNDQGEGKYISQNLPYNYVDNVYKSSTRITALPQLLHSNTEFLQSLFKGTTSSDLVIDGENKLNFIDSKNRRIPIETVNQLEKQLESEYMPFYFHDLRTNELLSFHAFIESISDSFSPEYNSASGFGRIDDVKTYVKTTRNINLTFILAATSEEDHDMMWYQVNKIVAMVYPQWSNGYQANTTVNKKIDSENLKFNYPFKYPFTQVPTASPLIRLRVGDVIKSNYSRTNLARLHGINQVNKNDYPDKFKKINNIADVNFNNSIASLETNFFETINKIKKTTNSQKIKIHKNIIKLMKQIDSIKTGPFRQTEIKNLQKKIKELQNKKKVELKRIEDQKIIKEQNNFFKKYNELLLKFDKEISNNELNEKFNSLLKQAIKELGEDLIKPEIGGKVNNPITRSYESGMSKGLAGFITNLDVGYTDSTWDIREGSKAPMLVKINIGFSPIHDIPPGLDHNGMLRAPMYDVGQINKALFHGKLDDDE